ncbi:hypothetical protein Tco_0716534 [Tanacetum coccineum]
MVKKQANPQKAGVAIVTIVNCYIVLGKHCKLLKHISNPFSSTNTGDDNPIRTLGDYSKLSHEGYRNTIELPIGNNVVHLRSDTIRLVKNGCLFHRLRSEDPNQYLKDFLKLVDSLDLDGENRERMRLQDIALYDNESWNDPRDFAKPVKAITLPQDVPSTFDCRLIELENQVQRLMEAHLAPTQPTQVNKFTTSCEIYSGNSMVLENIASINHIEREELKRKGIKSLSKLFSPNYLSPASIIELNKNPSAPKRIHFINSIIILSKESQAEEGETTTDITPEHNHNITKEAKGEVKEVMEEDESEVETDWEVEEILEEEE